ncbi:MAG TPA: phenylalanine--tRNA ligase beta subunit-related protein [Symbiobacteriaceae bacterium]
MQPKFTVAPAIFERFPDLCFGVVVAEGVDNQGVDPEIANLVQAGALALSVAMGGMDVREHPHVAVWREAFRKLDLNPNKFPSSIEALAKRVVKKPEMPTINKVVDLGNSFSLKYILPMGAHDLDVLPGDIEVRFARPDDVFIPFGATEPEVPDAGEVVYATGNQIRTRKWVWRQGEMAKVVEQSQRIFFPIDAWYGVTDQAARAARSELAAALERFCGAKTRVFWVDRDHPSVELV